MDKITLELPIVEVQEILYTIKEKGEALVWVLENKDPKHKQAMVIRAQLLLQSAKYITDLMNKRALEKQANVG